mmetsp:Transcript_12043/g.17287  ORF Transcript_12043/g.17287 Transcript_12043/m.17287 type:complete len:328 (+) Transcript_12043:1212-2195(+)
MLSSPSIDLSIIIPTFNVIEFIEELIVSMYRKLASTRFEFEVFFVDDGSFDGTIDILEKYEKKKSNFYFLTTAGEKGAGYARNMAIPLVEGRFVYFADSDDTYDFQELLRAVNFAKTHNKDLLLFPYKMEYITPKKSKIGGMMQNDVETWEKAKSSALNQENLKQFALELTGYPWKQLTCSTLMSNADSFFGPTSVHNDINFHWLSVAQSENMHFYEFPVPTHRKFNNGLRSQISQIKSEIRLRLFDAVALTQRALARLGVFENGSKGAKMLGRWENFSKALFQWGSSRVPESVVEKYQIIQADFYQTFDDAKENPKVLRTWTKKEY